MSGNKILKSVLRDTKKMTLDDYRAFYEKHIANKPNLDALDALHDLEIMNDLARLK